MQQANRRLALWSQRRESVTLVVERLVTDATEFGEDNRLVELDGEERDPESGELSYRVLRIAGVQFSLFEPVCGTVSCGTGGGDGCQAGHLVKLIKKEQDAPFWSSLHAKDGPAPAGFLVRNDWSRWIDEDDDDAGELGGWPQDDDNDADANVEFQDAEGEADVADDGEDDDDEDEDADEDDCDDDDEDDTEDDEDDGCDHVGVDNNAVGDEEDVAEDDVE